MNEGGTSAEISFADVDTVMTSPIKNGKDEGLMTEIAELRAKNAELEEALKATVFCHTHIREEENDSTCYSLVSIPLYEVKINFFTTIHIHIQILGTKTSLVGEAPWEIYGQKLSDSGLIPPHLTLAF